MLSIVDYLKQYTGYTVNFLFYFYEYNCKKKLIEVCDDEYSYFGFAEYFKDDHVYFYDFIGDIDIRDCDTIHDDSRLLLVIEYVSDNPPDKSYPHSTPMDEIWGC